MLRRMHFPELLFLVFLTSMCSAQSLPELTVWLMPAENAGASEMARGEDIRSRVEKFNAEFAPAGLTVLNTIDPLAMKLVSWNPEFAVPNASWIFSQKRTLNALARFARDKHVRIRVRFITWGEAFGLLSEIDPGKHSENDPDVVEIGSTWAANFASKRLTMSRPGWDRDRANWKDVLDLTVSALHYD